MSLFSLFLLSLHMLFFCVVCSGSCGFSLISHQAIFLIVSLCACSELECFRGDFLYDVLFSLYLAKLVLRDHFLAHCSLFAPAVSFCVVASAPVRFGEAFPM